MQSIHPMCPPQNLIGIQAGTRAPWAAYAQSLQDGRRFRWPRSGGHNDKAHPPIHPTQPFTGDGDKARLYEFICRHFLACVAAVGEGTDCNGQMYGNSGVNSTFHATLYLFDPGAGVAAWMQRDAPPRSSWPLPARPFRPVASWSRPAIFWTSTHTRHAVERGAAVAECVAYCGFSKHGYLLSVEPLSDGRNGGLRRRRCRLFRKARRLFLPLSS